MRRILLSFLLIASLTIGGTVNAWAAQDCPYLNAAGAMADHDCCPEGAMTDGMEMPGSGDEASSNGEPQHQSDTPFDCQPGQACRAAIGITGFPAALVSFVADARLVRNFANDIGSPLAEVELNLRPPISA